MRRQAHALAAAAAQAVAATPADAEQRSFCIPDARVAGRRPAASHWQSWQVSWQSLAVLAGLLPGPANAQQPAAVPQAAVARSEAPPTQAALTHRDTQDVGILEKVDGVLGGGPRWHRRWPCSAAKANGGRQWRCASGDHMLRVASIPGPHSPSPKPPCPETLPCTCIIPGGVGAYPCKGRCFSTRPSLAHAQAAQQQRQQQQTYQAGSVFMPFTKSLSQRNPNLVLSAVGLVHVYHFLSCGTHGVQVLNEDASANRRSLTVWRATRANVKSSCLPEPPPSLRKRPGCPFHPPERQPLQPRCCGVGSGWTPGCTRAPGSRQPRGTRCGRQFDSSASSRSSGSSSSGSSSGIATSMHRQLMQQHARR